jgi:DNA-binding transcriptional LysR family regulator
VPAAACRLAADHPGLELRLVEAEPPQAVRMLRDGEVDAAVVFRYQDGAPDDDGIRSRLLLAEPTYLLSADGGAELAGYRDGDRIAGCERCRGHLLDMCAAAGFRPRIAFTTDDYVAVQSLVAAGLGVTTLPGLALAAARNPGVRAAELADSTRYVLAATYGEPPDPPATAALLAGLTEAASGVVAARSARRLGRAAQPHGPA